MSPELTSAVWALDIRIRKRTAPQVQRLYALDLPSPTLMTGSRSATRRPDIAPRPHRALVQNGMSTMQEQGNSVNGSMGAAPPTNSFQVQGAEVTDAVKKLLHDGNVRRIVVKNDHDQTIFEIPVTVGVVVAIAAPVLVAVAAVAAVVKDCRIEVHRETEEIPVS